MKFRTTILFALLIGQSLQAQNMWMWNQRTHPELEWQTLETDHFNIHFHQGIEDIAHLGAAIAEQAYQPIMDQLEVADFGKTDIVFSAEDEIMNGFAMPTNQIFIWVSQNDVAGHFGGTDKWLKMVITHEFQHVVQFRAQRTWVGVLGAISIPHWWYEGMAEYMTEVWRVGRSDSQMKIHTYQNTLNSLEPHDDGFAKVLYLAWKYGDSTLVKISQHRLYLDQEQQKYPYWYNFATAFEEVTGQTLAGFNEEWRRAMNTYYYGYKAQKERVEDVGTPLLLKGFAQIWAARIATDSSSIAVVGRTNSRMLDQGLYVVQTDSTHQIEEIHHGRFSGDPDWSPDGSQVVVSEYHRGQHGSLVYDLRLVEVESKKTRWLTRDLRTHHPVFSRDGKGVFFVAHPTQTTQIFYLELASNTQIQITRFEGDVQLRDLDLSPSGRQLAFAIQEENGDVNIATMDIDGQNYNKITHDLDENIYPVWTQDGESIVFTSYRNSTPNLYKVDLDSLGITQMTDVAEALYSKQRLPNSDRIIAASLGDVDTVRIRSIEVDRVAPKLDLNIRSPFAEWRSKAPELPLPDIKLDPSLITSEARAYQARKTMRPLARLVWPDVEGLFGMAIYNDALGKHLVQGAAVLGWDGSFQGGYASYMNFNYKPALHFFTSQNLAFNLRQTFDQMYVEVRNGGGVSLELPMNTGSSLSSNHTLRAGLKLLDRELYISEPWGELEPEPTSRSSESNLGLTYMWKSQRPSRDQYILPRDGLGILAHIESAVPDLYGTNDYSQLWLEGFGNWAVPKSPLVFYTRLKWISQQGTILEQDKIGFSETSALYFSNAYWNTLKGIGLFDTPESYSLRGQTGNYPGQELVYSVSELRLSLFHKFPINILGFGIRNMTAATFLDFGYLPESGTDLSTYGVELKFDLSFMQVSLLTLSLGYGGDEAYWQNQGSERQPYLQMALVNPF